MATITSVQTGNWEDTTTWDNGVPTATDDVVITPSHKITIKTSITLSSVVDIKETSELILGVTGGVIGEIILNGCTIQGLGALRMYRSSIKSTNNWSYIKCKDLNVIPTSNSLTFTSWDLRNITFENVNNINMYLGASKQDGFTPLFVTENLVFKNCGTVRFHRGGSIPTPKRANVRRCTFINTNISCGSINAEYFFDKCVVTNTTKKDLLISSNSVQQSSFTNSVFLNTEFKNLNTVTFVNCYSGNNIPSEGSGYLYGLGKDTISVTDCIGFVSADVKNSRAMLQPNVSGCFVEDLFVGGSNTFIASGTINWTDNILVGNTDGFTSVISESVASNYNIINNTRIGTTFSTLERNTPLEGSVVKYTNNLHVPQGDTSQFIITINAMPNPYTIDVDYNSSYNPSVWVGEPLVNGNGTHNITQTDINYPDFVEMRSHVTLAETLGGTDYKDVWNYFEGLNGYDESTNRHSNQSLADTVISDALNYFREGYTPQNMVLATAGENGTYIGAVMPKEGGIIIDPDVYTVMYKTTEVLEVYYKSQKVDIKHLTE